MGFEANPVDPCIFNRVSANGKRQLTLAIHVDDGLATCEDLEEWDMNFVAYMYFSSISITYHLLSAVPLIKHT